MTTSVEVLIFGNETERGLETVKAAAQGAIDAGLSVTVTEEYEGSSQWLCVHAAGQSRRRYVCAEHRTKNRPVVGWDHGYFDRINYMRVSINDLHPQNWLERTSPEPSRWEAFGITLRNDADRKGPIIVAGMGGRTRALRNGNGWERWQISLARARYPKRQIIYRPKPDIVSSIDLNDKLGADAIDTNPNIEETLKGASLLICAHSSAAIDACIAGVPVECSDGAAFWLYSRHRKPTTAVRLDFLQRLAWWNWRLTEMDRAWRFLIKVAR